MPEENSLNYKKRINAPADLIYRAFVSATALREWLCHVSTTNPGEGGWIYLAWNHGYFASGHFTKLVPDQVVSFTWIGKGEPGWSHVEVVISTLDNEDSCVVVLRHTGIGKGSEWEEARKEINQGWEVGLENLKATLEHGHDLRIINRPLMGIFPLDYSPDTKKEQKNAVAPVDYGVQVSNVIPGYGADKAGIRAGDVIVAIGDQKIERIKTLAGVMDAYSPGDQISVDVYRGENKLTFNIDTSGQIIQDLPESPEELAKELESSSTKILDTLERIFTGVTEAEAAYSPSSEIWSAKETLVHLIHRERDLHSWINELVSDQERFYDEMPGDCLFRIRATLTTYPKLNDLMAELRRSLKETVASVAFLDQSFTRRKASYWRLGHEMLEKFLPYQEHIRHIEENIQAARRAISV